MKKLLLLLLSILLLQSCMIKEGWTVQEVEKYSSETSIYHVGGPCYFHARKGLYNVGDTVKFTK